MGDAELSYRASLDQAAMWMADAEAIKRRRAWDEWAGADGRWAQQRSSTGLRDTQGTIRYFSHEAPKDFAAEADADIGGTRESSWDATTSEYGGLVELVMSPESDNLVPLNSTPHPMSVLDARSAEGGLASWDFDRNGFCFIEAPTPVNDFRDRGQVRHEYQPRVIDAVKAQTGCSQVIFMSHLFRFEGAYARFAHTAYSSHFEPLLRRMLVGREGMSEDAANSCGLCTAGLWSAVEYPAYREPLALLDCTSVDFDTDVIEFIDVQSDLGFKASMRPADERVPAATQDAPALAPLWSPRHQWVFCPDMAPDESVLFKQYLLRFQEASPHVLTKQIQIHIQG